jgi:hypothetical protein
MTAPDTAQLGLPVLRAVDIPSSDAPRRWLIDQIWTAQAVGFIGGLPKCCKSWLGLDFAVSVASATRCLDRFTVDDPGPALVYLAEDSLPMVRERIASVCAHRSLDLAALDLHVISVPVLRLDLEQDRARLAATIARLHPKLLLLDPLVRMHRLDEDRSSDMSALLGSLRQLQREHAVAIVLVHHLGKRSRAQLGQALRGSGDLHAWSDDNAFLTRQTDRLVLSLEHRAAPAAEPLALRLAARPDGSATHLELISAAPNGHGGTNGRALCDAILAALRSAAAPLQRAALRTLLRVNNERLGDALRQLERQHLTHHGPAGWTLARSGTPD